MTHTVPLDEAAMEKAIAAAKEKAAYDDCVGRPYLERWEIGNWDEVVRAIVATLPPNSPVERVTVTEPTEEEVERGARAMFDAWRGDIANHGLKGAAQTYEELSDQERAFGLKAARACLTAANQGSR